MTQVEKDVAKLHELIANKDNAAKALSQAKADLQEHLNAIAKSMRPNLKRGDTHTHKLRNGKIQKRVITRIVGKIQWGNIESVVYSKRIKKDGGEYNEPECKYDFGYDKDSGWQSIKVKI